jgi:hypothetical protein
LNRIKESKIDQHVTEQGQKFHRKVGPEVQRLLVSLHNSTTSGQSEPELIPSSLGKVVSDYCKDWPGESETVLDNFSDNCLRTQIGMMSILEMTSRHILKLEKEIQNLKNRSTIESQPAVSMTRIETPSVSDGFPDNLDAQHITLAE